MKYVFIDNSGSMSTTDRVYKVNKLKDYLKTKHNPTFIYVSDRVYVQIDDNVPLVDGPFFKHKMDEYIQQNNINLSDCVFITDGEMLTSDVPVMETYTI